MPRAHSKERKHLVLGPQGQTNLKHVAKFFGYFHRWPSASEMMFLHGHSLSYWGNFFVQLCDRGYAEKVSIGEGAGFVYHPTQDGIDVAFKAPDIVPAERLRKRILWFLAEHTDKK